MEFTLQTPGKPSPVTQTATPEPPAEQKTSAAAAEPAKPTGSPGESAKTAGSGSPADQKPEKPARAAAAASRKQRQADQAAKDADAKKADADKVAANVEKYRAAVESGDVDKILDAFGLDDEKIVDLYLAKHGTKDEDGETREPQTAAEVKALKAELEKFKKDLADEKTKAEEKRQQEQAQTQVQQMVGEIQAIASKPENAEKFELCNAAPEVIRALTGGEYQSAAAAAFDVAVHVWDGGKGERISFEKALELTEAHLLKQHEALAGGLGKLKKLGGKASEKKPEGEKPTETKADDGQPPTGLDAVRARFKASRPRVTNGFSAIHPSTPTGPRGKAAADQRMREKVLALVKGQTN